MSQLSILLNPLFPIALDIYYYFFLKITKISTFKKLLDLDLELQKDLLMAFIDLSKAFDSISREALWKVLARFGCPLKFISVLRLLHNRMTAAVLCNGMDGQLFNLHRLCSKTIYQDWHQQPSDCYPCAH